jgi:hypothetical protein
MQKSGLFVLVLSLAGCATTLTEEGQKVKASIESKAAGNPICWNHGIWEFIQNGSRLTPSKECLYPTSRIVLDNVEVPRGNQRLLRIRQVTEEGFMVEGILFAWKNGLGTYQSNKASENVVFVYRSDEKDKIDGSFLDQTFNSDLYQYTGVYKYTTPIGGSKSVYSFKKFQPVSKE